jgi:hypothetical protein
MRILGRENAIARISTHSFSDRRLSRVEERVQKVFEEAGGVVHFVVTSLPVGQQ